MKNFPIGALCISFFMLQTFSLEAQEYKVMMDDPKYSIPQVKAAAEAYFEEHGKGEGSGYKGYQRWLWANEYKYAPSGDRSSVDPYFLKKQWEQIESTMASSASSSWQDLGPYTIDSLSGGYNPGLGRVECFFVDPNDQDYLYLGSRSGGFWKSTDGGQNWLGSSTEFMTATGVNTMAVNPSNRDSVLINLRNARNGTSHGIFRSVDGGQTWTITNFGPANVSWTGLGENGQVYQLYYHPTIKDRVYVGTNRGLFISNDDLQTWTQVLPSADITHIQFHPTDSDVVYIYDDYYWGTNGDVILISNDGGLTFTSSATLSANNGSNVEIAVSPDCPDCLYAASANGVWKSTDKGQNFTFMMNPPGVCDGFAVSDVDTSIMIYGMLEIYRSANGGQSFSKVANWFINGRAGFNSPQYVHADLREIRSLNGEFFIGTDGYLAKSTNTGQDWQRLSRGVGIREFYSIGLSQSEVYSTMAGSQDNGTSIYRKEGWIEFYGADGMEPVIHPLKEEWMMGSVQFGTRRLTFDAGRTQQGATPQGQSGAWEAPLNNSTTDHFTLYHFGEDVYRSDDFGQTWVNRGSPLFNDETVRAAVAPNDGDILAVSRGSSFEMSFNAGQTFRYRGNGLPSASITDIAFAPFSDSIIMVTYGTYQNNGEKIFITYDQGNSWTNITGNLVDMPLRTVIMDESPDHNLYVGAEIGVYTKPLVGGSWTLFNSGLPNMTVTDLEIMAGSNYLRASTWGRGMWQISLKDRADYPKIVSTDLEHPLGFHAPTDAMAQHIRSAISYSRILDTVYLRWSANGLGLDSTIAMVNVQDSTWESVAPIPAFGDGTDLYFRVFAVGDAGDTSITARFHYRVRGTGYCQTGNNANFTSNYIEEVYLGSFQNISGRAAYTDFTSLYATVNTNQSYNLDILGRFLEPNDVLRVWIDYNDDQAFSPDEMLPVGTFDPFNYARVSFTVPQFSQTDTVRMRLRIMADYLEPDACNLYQGEAEDYSLVIVGNGLSVSEWQGEAPALYPNPADDRIYLDLPSDFNLAYYRVLNSTGEIVLKADNLQDYINLGGLAKGSYILELHHSEGQVWRSNFIKN